MAAAYAAWSGINAYRRSLAERSQDLEHRARELEYRLRTQATQVTAWYSGEGRVTVKNASSAAVWNVIAIDVNVNESNPDGAIVAPGTLTQKVGMRVVPPGTEEEYPIEGWGGHAPGRRDGIELAFTDSDGQHWVRTAHGQLDRLAISPLERHEMPRPGPM